MQRMQQMQMMKRMQMMQRIKRMERMQMLQRMQITQRMQMLQMLQMLKRMQIMQRMPMQMLQMLQRMQMLQMLQMLLPGWPLAGLSPRHQSVLFSPWLALCLLPCSSAPSQLLEPIKGSQQSRGWEPQGRLTLRMCHRILSPPGAGLVTLGLGNPERQAVPKAGEKCIFTAVRIVTGLGLQRAVAVKLFAVKAHHSQKAKGPQC